MTWTRILGCYSLTVARSCCQYEGLVDLGAGPVMAKVRYYFTPAGWPLLPRAKLPHRFDNPWWDVVAHDASRWTPGVAPSWRNGSVPAGIEPCPCWDEPLLPPCSVHCGQMGYVLDGGGIAYTGSSADDVHPGLAVWDGLMQQYTWTETIRGAVFDFVLSYRPGTDDWLATLAIDGTSAGSIVLHWFGVDWFNRWLSSLPPPWTEVSLVLRCSLM